MKNILCSILLLSVFSLSLHAQIKKESRTIGQFSGIDVCCGINVHLQEGNSPSVVVKGETTLVDDVKTEVRNSTLKIFFDSKFNKTKGKKGRVDVYVTTSNKLKMLDLSSGSSISNEKEMNLDKIKIDLSSGSNLNLRIKASLLDLNLGSGANANFTGTAIKSSISVSSGSNANLKNLTVEESEIKASSGGSVELAVRQKISASASSGGRIIYYGTPSAEKIKKSSGGSVTKR